MTRTDLRRLAPLGLISVIVLALSACSSGDSSSFPDLQPFPPDLKARLHEIRDTAAEVRGLSTNDSVKEGQVARDVLRQYWEDQAAAMSDDDRRETEALDAALKLLHVIGPGDDLLDIAGSEFSEGILGFYFPNDDRLALVAENAGALDGEDEVILAHEYVHSFQDVDLGGDHLQKLVAEEQDDSRTEYRTTISCLKEGDAYLAMQQYGKQVYGDDWYEKTFGAGQDDAGAEDRPTSPFMERYYAFDYTECPQFVNAIYEDGGWPAVNALYDDPPATTEQILDPEKYRTREFTRTSAPESAEDSLGEGWKLLNTSLFGEFDVYNYVATILDDEFAGAVVADGWGAGWISVYTRDGADGGSGTLVRIQLDWDSSRDMAEFLAAYGPMVQIVSGGQMDGDRVAGPVRWGGGGQYGYVSWDDKLNRVQIVVSSDESARESVAAAY